MPTYAGVFDYGWTDDWVNGGTSYGPQFLYYVSNGTSGSWIPVPTVGFGSAALNPTADANVFEIEYEITKSLLLTY